MREDTDRRPVVVVIGGPNGAGKTTSAKFLLPDGVAMEAGRLMLRWLRELAEQRENFAFETTLASRSFTTFLRELQAVGYSVRVAYVWLRTPDLSVERVAARVLRGGHHVPEETIRRRYGRGIVNFDALYRPIADSWL